MRLVLQDPDAAAEVGAGCCMATLRSCEGRLSCDMAATYTCDRCGARLCQGHVRSLVGWLEDCCERCVARLTGGEEPAQPFIPTRRAPAASSTAGGDKSRLEAFRRWLLASLARVGSRDRRP